MIELRVRKALDMSEHVLSECGEDLLTYLLQNNCLDILEYE